jgi:hypothetical protein
LKALKSTFLADPFKRPSTADGPPVVVGVVGIGHVAGIVEVVFIVFISEWSRLITSFDPNCLTELGQN